ncbi:MAG: hypothetical protein Q8R78_01580 [Candidatus Omnitrophota bacterium]|nr:hypothetical protein [Candidatus Omnitrophota bacterium]
MKEIPTTAEVRALLRKRYEHPEWALCFEVANGTGGSGLGTRYADAVAMNLYPSRGLSLHGFEIKVAKQDFVTEIKNPEKSIPVQKYCDHWWLVAPAFAVDEALLPKTWGWLRVDNNRLVTEKKAPELEATLISRSFMAAMVRRANVVDQAEVDKLVRSEVERLRKQDSTTIEREVTSRTRKGDEALKTLAALKEKIGIASDSCGYDFFDTEEIALAIKMIRTSGVASNFNGLCALQRQLQMATERLSDALDVMVGKQGALKLEVGRSRSQVGRTAAHTFRRTAYNLVDDAKLKELWPSPLPDRELAARLQHDISVLRRRAKALGLQSRRAIWAASCPERQDTCDSKDSRADQSP